MGTSRRNARGLLRPTVLLPDQPKKVYYGTQFLSRQRLFQLVMLIGSYLKLQVPKPSKAGMPRSNVSER
ncbi:MAG: hypothetical protein ACI822_002836, partial [Gammaproteobacteria bacterium]